MEERGEGENWKGGGRKGRLRWRDEEGESVVGVRGRGKWERWEGGREIDREVRVKQCRGWWEGGEMEDGVKVGRT